uniref:Uncharacterized protein n=1 Tax=Opuntia streptacantha TaxID=393608 RepID=A0A7C9EXB4_OPUST
MHQIAQPNTMTAIEGSLTSLILLTHQVKPQPQLQNSIISAKWGRSRSGSRRTRKLILDSIAFVASNIKILPEPLDSLAKEFLVAAAAGGGGNGGKFWLRKGFGGGGDERNPRGEKLGFWVPLMISSALALWVVLERERGLQNDSYFWVLLIVSAFALYCMVRGWRREIKDWVLGFSCGAALMGLGLRHNENFVKWVDKFGANFPNLMPIAKKRRKARRWI